MTRRVRAARWVCRALALVTLVWMAGTALQVVAAPVVAQHAAAKPCSDPLISPSCTLHTLDPRTGGPLDPNQCKDKPAPQSPGTGLSGTIDAGDPHPDPKAAADNIYERYGYPPPWSTYDLGCLGNSLDWGANIDTMIGNWLMGTATSIAALCDALHRFVSPPTFMNHFDPLMLSATAAVRDAIFTPFIGVSVLVLGIGLVFAARRRDVPRAFTAIAWAGIVMAVATALWSYPVQAGRAVDNGTAWMVSTVYGHMTGTNPDSAASARAELLVENVLYKPWLLGEVGSTTPGKHVTQQALALLGDQAYTYDEAARISSHGDQATKITKAKQDDFAKKAGDLKKHYPDAYRHLQGKAGGRIGAGAVAVLGVLCVAPFMLMSSLLVVVAAFIVRWLAILGLAIAVVVVHLRMRRVAFGIAGRGVNAIINAVFFSIGAALATLITGAILSPTVGLPLWASFVLCAVGNYVLWHMFKPLRHLTTTVNPNVRHLNARRARRQLFTSHYRRIRRFQRRTSGNLHAVESLLGEVVRKIGGDPQVAGAGATAGAGVATASADTAAYEGWVASTYEGWAAPPPTVAPRGATHTTTGGGGPTTLPPPPDDPARGTPETPDVPHTMPADTTSHTPADRDDILPAEPAAAEPPAAASDPVIIDDGTTAWRIWNPATGGYDDIPKPPEERSA